VADRPFNVLFLCTGNSARSIIAEAILNKVSAERFRAYSAGSHPKGSVHPETLRLLQALGYGIAGLRSKSWNEFIGPKAPKIDFVLTVCDNAAAEACPHWPGQPMTAHWGVPDRLAGRDRARFQGCLSHAQPAHRNFHILADTIARSNDAAKQAQRDRPRLMPSLAQRTVAECLGTAFLLAGVVGSGIMATKLAGGNDALALLCNTLPTGAILAVLILSLGRVSGAHFNPAVSIAFALRRELPWREAAAYIVVQIGGGLVGVWVAHLMFELRVWQISSHARTGSGQWLAEFVATFGLLLTILGCAARNATALPYAVGLYITAAYWFTASTSFANPAVTIARSLSDTFAGIAPGGVVAFITAQLAGMLAAVLLASWFWTQTKAQ